MTHVIDPGSPRPPLRVGVLLGSMRQPRWVHALLDAVAASPFSTIALVVVHEPSRRGTWGGRVGDVQEWLTRLVRRQRHWLYTLYRRVDDALFRLRPDPFELASIEPVVACRPLLRVASCATEHGDLLPPDAIDAILGHDLDVALQFGRRLRGRALLIARYGIWSCEAGETGASHRDTTGFWEMMEGRPITAATLRQLRPEPNEDRVIALSFARTDKRSASGNQFYCYQRGTALVVRTLRGVYEHGPDALAASPPPPPDPAMLPGDARARAAPTNAEMLVSMVRKGRCAVRSRLERAGSFAQWFIAYRFDDDGTPPCDAPPFAGGGFRHIVPPSDRFWADPFPVEWDGRYGIFVEQYVYRERKAHIAVLELGRDGTWGPPVPVLERPYHLSYPFVFRWRDEYFMCPEARESGAVELYRATSFPYEWTRETTLLSNVRAVDPTLIEIDGRWWMFANVGQEGVSDPSCWDDELHLFHAPSPLGPWTPHRRNPVKSDLRSSRPAGRLFRLHGQLYRPAQNCTERYGSAITINRVVRIDPDDYHEVTVSEIPPRWAAGLLRTHTINAVSGLTVIDGQLMQRKRFRM